jgi:polyvinyl alcohol dehydrogenase (cytochrome)
MRSLLFFFASFVIAANVFGQDRTEIQNRCSNRTGISSISENVAWNGWGADTSNTRFKDTALQLSQLKLKWAFGFPGAKAVSGQPAVVGGRVFVSADTGDLYSIDSATGCLYWSFHAEATIRSAPAIERIANDRYAAYFGDAKANVYAIDASTGQSIWRVRVENHPTARITGAVKYFEGRLYVPVASGEEGAGGNPTY